MTPPGSFSGEIREKLDSFPDSFSRTIDSGIDAEQTQDWITWFVNILPAPPHWLLDRGEEGGGDKITPGGGFLHSFFEFCLSFWCVSLMRYGFVWIWFLFWFYVCLVSSLGVKSLLEVFNWWLDGFSGWRCLVELNGVFLVIKVFQFWILMGKV